MGRVRPKQGDILGNCYGRPGKRWDTVLTAGYRDKERGMDSRIFIVKENP